MPKFFVDGSTGDVSFYEDTGTTAEMFWDASAEALGIGTTTPAVKLDIDGTDAVRLPVGTDAQRPTGAAGQIRFNSDSDEFEGYDGTAWGALGGGGGKVLQVVSANYSTEVSSSVSSFTDTGLTATITPTSATSKILVLVNQAGIQKRNDTQMDIRLLRDASTIINDFAGSAGFTNSTETNYVGSVSTSYLDSPATTSSVTYKTQFNSVSSVFRTQVQSDSSTSTITLMEIAA